MAFSTFIRIKLHGKVKRACATERKQFHSASNLSNTYHKKKKQKNKTASHLNSWTLRLVNRPFATSSKWGFQWTKMLIHCQDGDILHRTGLSRLIKTSVLVSDSFRRPLCGFPSPRLALKSRKSIYHIYFVVISCLLLKILPNTMLVHF